MLSDLLQDAGAGYPIEYVIARIRGRRARLVPNWSAATATLRSGASDEEIWRAVTGEFAWLHRQLSPALRAALAPLFVLFELKTMVLAIRNTAVDRKAAVRTVLDRSLLADPLRLALGDAPNAAAAIAALETALTRLGAPFGALVPAHAGDQLRGFENTLMCVYLERAAAARLHPAVRAFVSAFIDARNVMLLYKRLRWGASTGGQYIAGGTLASEVFDRAFARQELTAVDALVSQITRQRGRAPAPTDVALETTLLNSLTKRVDRARRESNDVGVIVAYMWRVYAQARNLSVLHHATDVDPETLQRELMQ